MAKRDEIVFSVQLGGRQCVQLLGPRLLVVDLQVKPRIPSCERSEVRFSALRVCAPTPPSRPQMPPIVLLQIRHAVAAVATLVATAVVVWLITGVGIDQIAVFAGYELGYVFFPGWAVYRWLARRDGWARQLVFGFAVGYAIQVLMFVLAGALDARWIVFLYPVAALPVVFIGSRSRSYGRQSVDAHKVWATTAVAIAALLWLSVIYFAAVPLPWEVPSATYTTDLAYHLSLAAEAKHHWPLQDPEVAGTGLYYHVWAHLSMAATSEVTGLPLPLVLFRLWTVPLVFLVAAGTTVAARSLTRRVWAGPVAVALIFLVGAVDFESAQVAPFNDLFFTDLWLSPTFLLALVLFLPTVTLLAERLQRRESLARGLSYWLLLTVLFVACEGAKATVLPVVLGALALVLLLGLARERALDRNALAAFVLAATTLVFFYFAIYQYSSVGLEVRPLGSIERMPRAGEFLAHHGDLAWPVAVAFGTLALFGPQLAGLPQLLAADPRRDPARELLLALGVAGIGAFFVFSQFGGSQRFFSHYGLVACVFLSAEGLCLAAERARRETLRGALIFSLALAAALFFVAYIADQVQFWSRIHLGHALGPEAVAATTLVTGLAIWRWGLPDRRALGVAVAMAVPLLALSSFYALRPSLDLVAASYPVFAAILLLLAVVAVRAGRESRAQIVLLLLFAAVTGGALDLPLDHVQQISDRVRDGKPLYPVDASAVDQRLYNGLRWLRHNTSTRDVLAVNNHLVWVEGIAIPAYYDYAAFSERRVFLGGWLYSAKTWKIGGDPVVHLRAFPYPVRLRLNDAVFLHGDESALKTMVTRYRVRYLVVDRLKGPKPPPGWHLGRVVFSNPAVAIYAVSASGV